MNSAEVINGALEQALIRLQFLGETPRVLCLELCQARVYLLNAGVQAAELCLDEL